MEDLVQALGGLLLKAVPTIVLLIFVHLYLKAVFFRPLQDVLRKRRDITEGAVEAGKASLAKAAEKAAMYEMALKEARAEMYREQEEMRRRWLDDQTKRIEETRQRSRAMIQEAGKQLDVEIVTAKRDLTSSSQMLALQIVESLAGARAK